MPNALQMAGATAEPSNFAPLHTNRIFTGLWTNRSALRDAATSDYQEHYGMGRQDSILGGYNSEITPRLTLARRAGSSVYNKNTIPPVNRFYSFNTFTLTSETIRVLADTAATVLDITVDSSGNASNKTIWTKSSGAQSTYFLGVGNILYFTNGVDNKQWNYAGGQIWNWGIQAPANAPTVSQAPRPSSYPTWASGMVFSVNAGSGPSPTLAIVDPNNNIQTVKGLPSLDTRTIVPPAPPSAAGTTGAQEPNPWATGAGQTTTDGTVTWTNAGTANYQTGHAYGGNDMVAVTVSAPAGQMLMLFINTTIGLNTSGTTPPQWNSGLGSLTPDANGIVWQNIGMALKWTPNIGANTPITGKGDILDPNGYTQRIKQAGKTGATVSFSTEVGAYTQDGTAIWVNTGPYAVAATAPQLYGFEFMNSTTNDLSGMSPQSLPITVIEGNDITIQGQGSGDPQVDSIVLFRTAQGGSTFLYLATIPNPGAGKTWTYVDNTPDANLNTEWQAQVSGEGTPLPAGATCLGYHLGRIFAAVGNVVYISSGPDAVVGGSSGNAGFDTTFTAQSKITRFWTCTLGMVVFTVRDAYIILGSATSSDPLYMVVFIEDLPLRSYDCFTVNKTTPYLLQGNQTLVALDPSAGITEIGFPIADLLETEFTAASVDDTTIPKPAPSYVTFHKRSSRDTALYVANGIDHWYRMAANNAPEAGSAWSPRANFPSLGCVQSVEVLPGQYRLLMSGTSAGPILERDRTVNTDNGTAFAAQTRIGSIVLAQPGQLAALHFITLESVRIGTAPTLALLLGEINGTFEPLNRTRQDPTNLPPSNTLFSDRYHFAQNQQCAWCRHFQMEVSWLAEDAPNELLTFTIFGQTWQEMRAQ